MSMKTRGNYLYWKEGKGKHHKILRGRVQVARERDQLRAMVANATATDMQKARLDYLDGMAL